MEKNTTLHLDLHNIYVAIWGHDLHPGTKNALMILVLSVVKFIT